MTTSLPLWDLQGTGRTGSPVSIQIRAEDYNAVVRHCARSFVCIESAVMVDEDTEAARQRCISLQHLVAR